MRGNLCLDAAYQTKAGKQRHGMLSAIQVGNGLKKGAVTYLSAFIEVKPDHKVEIPDKVAEILKEFADVMPSELQKNLPPRRAIDHKIDIVPGAKPPARAPYRMSPLELAELRKQLTELRRLYPAFQGTIWGPCAVPEEARWLFAHVCGLSCTEQSDSEEQVSCPFGGRSLRPIVQSLFLHKAGPSFGLLESKNCRRRRA